MTKVLPTRYSNTLRPSERVLHFFYEELEPSHVETGGRLPTIKEVSKHLGVSISTVQAVFAELGRQGKLVTIPGKGTFLNGSEMSSSKKSVSQHTLAVLIYEMELMGTKSTWGKEICAAMLREAANNRKEKLTIHPFFSNTHGQDPKLIAAEIAHSSAAIAFPGEHSERVAREFQAQGKPVIFITPPSLDSTENFVGPDFLKICRHVAKGWKATGRKHIVILLHALLSEGSSSMRSLAGFEMELQKRDGSEADLSYHSLNATDHPNVATYLEPLFKKKPYPDAIYATGDMIAARVVDWLLQHKIRIPEDVSVIGGTGLHPAHNAQMACTVVQQPFEKMGIEAVQMALRTIRSGNEFQPGKFIPATIRPEQTTRAIENEWFRKHIDPEI